jgi:hypothetical protein
MPAVPLDRLTEQIDSIFLPDHPGEVFIKDFLNLISIHGNYAYRAGDTVQRKSLLPVLRVAPVVMNAIQNKFRLLCEQDPETALDYADQLWNVELYECKYFASIIIGTLPNEYRDQVISRFVDWSSSTTDREIHQILFKNGSSTIIKHNSSEWLSIISEWIDKSSVPYTLTAIYALQSLVQDSSFINFPKVFNILTPLFMIDHRKITSGMVILFETLATQNPIETSYFLSNLLLTTTNPNAKQITKKTLKYFPAAEQKKLRSILSNLND